MFRTLSVVVFLFGLSEVCVAQIVTKNGEVFGRVTDDQRQLLSGVLIQLTSNMTGTLERISEETGAFRFPNLPPGEYSATFELSGFAGVQQNQIRVTIGSRVELSIVMTRSITEQVDIAADPGVLNFSKSVNSTVYTQEYLEQVPNGRDPWFLLAMTAGVDSSRLDTGAGSVFQSAFFARGDSFLNNTWTYDGMNQTDPASPGTPPAYYDFEAFEEIQITTGGNDVSIQSGGIGINLVTKRGGNQWEGQTSLFRSHETADYGFHAGGPIKKDKLFVWGGYRYLHDETQEDVLVRSSSKIQDINAKLNWNWNKAHSSQLGYFKAFKNIDNWEIWGDMSPEASVDQTTGPGHGVWTVEHTWVPNSELIFTGRYAFVGTDLSIAANGGTDKPIIFLAPILRFESTGPTFAPFIRDSHNANFDSSYFLENFTGGDHEFRFGFEYKTSDVRSFFTYGNGIYLYDLYQTVPNGPLTAGYLTAQHPANVRISEWRTSAYISDTFRRERLSLTFGVRYDFQTGENHASDVPGVPGFEEFVGPFSYPGGDPGLATHDFSPRLGLTYSVTADHKTLLKANYARYYDVFNPQFIWHSNPTAVSNGVNGTYVNADGDRTITLDELVDGPNFYGGNVGGTFDLEAFAASRIYDSNLSNAWTNELILGLERELFRDFSLAATFTYRRYGNFLRVLPFGVTSEDYVPGGVFTASTELGDFNVPFFVLNERHDGTAILTNIKDYEQSYRGLDITLIKRMSNNFLLNGTLTLQKQTGHYNGGDSLGIQTEFSMGNGATYPFDPTNLPFVQDHAYSYASFRGSNNPFSEWSLKFSGVYLFPWNISTGAFVRYQQGYPMILFGRVRDDSLSAFYRARQHSILVEPIGSRRYDNIFTVDFQIQKTFEFDRIGRFSGILTIFNLTNADTVTVRERFLDRFNFNDVLATLDSRSYRFGLRYSF